MTTAARDLLAEFDALPETDQHAVAVEILRRTADYGELRDENYDEIAAEVFKTYEAEEAHDAESSAR